MVYLVLRSHSDGRIWVSEYIFWWKQMANIYTIKCNIDVIIALRQFAIDRLSDGSFSVENFEIITDTISKYDINAVIIPAIKIV